MPDIPNTENFTVAALAIAWEIVKRSYITPTTLPPENERLKELTNAVIKAYTAILSKESIQ
jgi:hypothetical protein